MDANNIAEHFIHPEELISNSSFNSKSFKRRKRIIFGIIALVLFVGGSLIILLDEEPRVDHLLRLVIALPLSLLSYIWSRYDAIEREYRLPRLLIIFYIFVLPVGMGYYLFRTRGFVKGTGMILMITLIGIALCLAGGLSAWVLTGSPE